MANKRKRGSVGGLARFVGLLLIGAAIVREVRLPPEQRTWHGVLFGRIPYDLRVPTFERVMHSMWDPDNPRILVPAAFGVGWTINAAALMPFVRGGLRKASA
jgi:Family of unknown function (DUF5808)